MGLDYYQILGVPRHAEKHEIKREYRKLALKWHPDRASDKELAKLKFEEIAQAYDVLSNDKYRAVFDQYGQAGLTDGVPDGHGGIRGGQYVFHGDPSAIFADVFGTNNPFAELYEGSSPFFEVMGRPPPVVPPQTNEYELKLTLKELYMGCTKRMKITKKQLTASETTEDIIKTLVVNVKPGWKEGTKLTFPKQGRETADDAVIIREYPDDTFRREGQDLIFKKSVHLCHALTGCVVEVPTLDSRTLSVPINDIICPGYKKVVPGEGMPGNNPGNLIIEFTVNYPLDLRKEQKSLIEYAFLLPSKLGDKEASFLRQLEEVKPK